MDVQAEKCWHKGQGVWPQFAIWAALATTPMQHYYYYYSALGGKVGSVYFTDRRTGSGCLIISEVLS